MKTKLLFVGVLSLFAGTLISAGTIWAAPGFFLQGGNSFLETATLGTTDNFDLSVITNNSEKLRISTNGSLLFGGNAGTSGQVLTSNGSGSAPSWQNVSNGTVTSVSVVSANGISGSVANATTTPAITLSLGAITPTTVNGLTISNTTGTLSLASGSTLATSGANSITLTSTATTNIILPTTGTLATLAGTEILTNKTLTTPTIGSFTNANHNHENLAGGGTISIISATTGTLTVGRGGSGATAFTDGGVLIGNGSGSVQSTSTGTAGQVLTSNGAGNDPSFQIAGGMTLLTSGTFSAAANSTFTAATTDVITSTGHGLVNGDKVTLTTTGTLPAGLTTETGYFIRDANLDTFKLSSINPYRTAVDITDNGSGTHTWTNAKGSIVLSFPARTHLRIIGNVVGPTSSSDLNLNFNADGSETANNYGTVRSTNGEGRNIDNSTSRIIQLGGTTSTADRHFELDVLNTSTLRKVGRFISGALSSGAQAGDLDIGTIVWNNTSDQITSLTLHLTSTAGMATGSMVYVFGTD